MTSTQKKEATRPVVKVAPKFDSYYDCRHIALQHKMPFYDALTGAFVWKNIEKDCEIVGTIDTQQEVHPCVYVTAHLVHKEDAKKEKEVLFSYSSCTRSDTHVSLIFRHENTWYEATYYRDELDQVVACPVPTTALTSLVVHDECGLLEGESL